MSIDEIVCTVLQSMSSGTGEAHSEELLFAEVLKQHPELISNQNDIWEAIHRLVQQGRIVHDPKMKNWIM